MNAKIVALVCMLAVTAAIIGIVMATDSDKPKEPVSSVLGQPDSKSIGAPENTKPVVPDGPHPVLAFTETVHDFGKQMIDSELKYSFVFKNKGDVTLNIDKVKAG